MSNMDEELYEGEPEFDGPQHENDQQDSMEDTDE